MAKAKKNQEETEVIESPVEELSKQGVAVYKEGMHPRQLRRAAEEKAKEVASEEAEAEEETPEETEE